RPSTPGPASGRPRPTTLPAWRRRRVDPVRWRGGTFFERQSQPAQGPPDRDHRHPEPEAVAVLLGRQAGVVPDHVPEALVLAVQSVAGLVQVTPVAGQNPLLVVVRVVLFQVFDERLAQVAELSARRKPRRKTAKTVSRRRPLRLRGVE